MQAEINLFGLTSPYYEHNANYVVIYIQLGTSFYNQDYFRL
jgi:hypothetical protein